MTDLEKLKQPSLKIPKAIAVTAKFLEKTAPGLLVKFISKIFVTPIHYPTPQREMEMVQKATQELCYVSKIEKKINIYQYKTDETKKRILLVHGWSGRGTQLYSIAKELSKLNYGIISFDGPAHGKSEGKQSTMRDFIDCIHEINAQYGPFEYIIGHSLGAMATANAISQGVKTNKAVLIAGGDLVSDVVADFTDRLELNRKFAAKLQKKFEKQYDLKMNDFSVSNVASKINIPCLVIHDTDDTDVPVKCAENIAEKIKNSDLVITSGLGHRKILGDKNVIEHIVNFVNK